MTLPVPGPAPVTPPSPAPPGAKRYDWHVYVYGGALAATLVAEAHGLYVNAQQRRQVELGLRERPDYRHRTFSENTWALAGFHPDDLAGGVDVPFGKLRRFAWLTFWTWFDAHVRTNGQVGQSV